MAAASNDEPRINDRIRAREVRLIGPDGDQLGIKPLPEALATARSLDLDLVEVAAEANPPVCRIMNFTKFKYEAQQRAKESRKKATNITVKEMKYRPKIGGGDFDTKTRKVAQFLGEGHKVKVTIMFRGREMQHPELGRRILDRVAEEVSHLGRVEVMPKQDGRNMTMVLGPDKKAQAAHAKKAQDTADEADEADDAGDEPTAEVPPPPAAEPAPEPAATEA
ncbi:translation initiation factor IF-3 [Dermatobacter hominis]|uniref:translation initiation factor IF-3 n=1 Tax=Dermatobacter hominis TaxID=2884263 RepID=UPI002868F75A|nr:translation initiation factor IF-3 [Dermatobacter hominis]